MSGADKCILCGASGEQAYSGLKDMLHDVPGEWDFLLCRGCGLYWMPVREDYSRAYTEDYFPASAASMDWRGALKEAIRLKEAGSPAGLWKGLAGTILGIVPPLKRAALLEVLCLDTAVKGRLLDLGCGRGELLQRMRRLGWDTLGVEPNPRAAAAAAENGLNIVNRRFEDLELEENSFDAVTMSHVIEHIADPLEVFRSCRRWLKPGGQLAVLAPNSGSLGHRLFSGAWQQLDPPRHCFVFSGRSLGLMAEKAGFRVRSVRFFSSNAAIVFRNSVRISRRQGRWRIPGIMAAAQLFKAVGELGAAFGLGEEVLLLAERTQPGPAENTVR